MVSINIFWSKTRITIEVLINEPLRFPAYLFFIFHCKTFCLTALLFSQKGTWKKKKNRQKRAVRSGREKKNWELILFYVYYNFKLLHTVRTAVSHYLLSYLLDFKFLFLLIIHFAWMKKNNIIHYYFFAQLTSLSVSGSICSFFKIYIKHIHARSIKNVKNMKCQCEVN